MAGPAQSPPQDQSSLGHWGLSVWGAATPSPCCKRLEARASRTRGPGSADLRGSRCCWLGTAWLASCWCPESHRPVLGMGGEERKRAGVETRRKAAWRGGGGWTECSNVTNTLLEADVGIPLLVNPAFLKNPFWGCEELIPDLTGVQILVLKTMASSCR